MVAITNAELLVVIVGHTYNYYNMSSNIYSFRFLVIGKRVGLAAKSDHFLYYVKSLI